MISIKKHKTFRVYLKPGDTVTATVDLVVVKKEGTNTLGYELHNIDSGSAIKFFSDEIKNDERDYGYLIKYAWDLDRDDKNYGQRYYEEKEE